MNMNLTRTENDAVTHSTTGSNVLDFFSVGGALRHRNSEEVIKLFDSGKFELDIYQCINNQKIEDHILEDRIEAVKKFKLNATPTLIINNKKFEKPLNYKNIKKTLEKLI